MACTIGFAACHDRPDDPRGLVRHRDGGDPGGFSREQIGQAWIYLIGIVFLILTFILIIPPLVTETTRLINALSPKGILPSFYKEILKKNRRPF